MSPSKEREPIIETAKRYTRRGLLISAASISGSAILGRCTGQIGGIGEYDKEEIKSMLKPNSNLQESSNQVLTDPRTRRAVLTYGYPLPTFLSMAGLAIWIYHKLSKFGGDW